MRKLLTAILLVAAIAVGVVLILQPWEQGQRDDLVLGMPLEPPHLDPTAGAAGAIDEVVYANVFEGLTRYQADGSIAPALAESWSFSDDGLSLTFGNRERD